MYTKGLVQLMRALRISEQTGTVIIEPVQQLNELPCLARLSLTKGNVDECQIMSKRGGEILLCDGKALTWLQSVGRLFWHWEEGTAAPLAASLQQAGAQQPGSEKQDDHAHSSVHREVSLPSIAASKPTLITEARIPRRVQDDQFALYILSSSREYRKILALVDGHRSIREIAMLSHTSSQQIMGLLLSLRGKKLIEL